MLEGDKRYIVKNNNKIEPEKGVLSGRGWLAEFWNWIFEITKKVTFEQRELEF